MTLPKYLYHYTSQKGLLGILQTNKLWMTNILYLNDSSEFTHTLDLVKSELENRKVTLPKRRLRGLLNDEEIDLDENKYRLYDVIEEFFNVIPNETGRDSYVFSLSKEEDNLNQWRGYCHNEIGFCIGFDHEKLLSIIKNKKEYEISKCIYGKDEKKELIKLLFDELESLLFKLNKDMKTEVLVKYFSEVIHISSYIKHESFKDENEYRIISSGVNDETQYRKGKSMIIPYIGFSPVDEDNRLPIGEIWVGPTPHKELSKLSVESLLKSEKYEGVAVEISKIPYRSW